MLALAKVFAATLLVSPAPSVALGPTATSSGARAPTVCNATWRDAARDRDVPVRIRIPEGTARVPVILFSHGLGGTVDAGTEWAEHWVTHGFAVVHLQHPGSDAPAMRDAVTGTSGRAGGAAAGARRGGRMGGRAAGRGATGVPQGVTDAMSGPQLVARVQDVSFVLDEMAKRPNEGSCALARLDLTRVGMSGHSFGAHTTQAVAGQQFPLARGQRSLPEPRVRAAIAFSPAPPKGATGAALDSAFGRIIIPFLSITGTRDEVPALTSITPPERQLPYAHMPAGGKYLLVFEGADHAAFSGNKVPGRARRGATPASPHVRDVTREVSLDFWRATLLDDAAARARLAPAQVTARLVQGDIYRAK